MKSASFLKLLARLWYHLGRRRYWFIFLVGLILLSAFAEVMTLGAILPFIAVLAAPEKALQYPGVAEFARALDITTSDQLVMPLTATFCIAAVIAGLMRIIVMWLSTRLTFASGADLSIEIYRRALYQPYKVHVARSSNEMISGITAKVGHTTLGVLFPLLTVISSSVLLVAITTALVIINPLVAILAAGGFGTGYVLITWFSQRRLNLNSQLIADEHTRVVKALQEGLGGIRDVLLDGTQAVYCEVYRQAEQRWRLAHGENVFIGNSPRFVMEALGIVLIALLAVGISRQPGGVAEALPVLGALALGAQRLLPVLQQGYAAWASIAGSIASFEDTIELLDQPLPKEASQPRPAPLLLRNEIRFEHVRFRYGTDGPWVLDDLDLVIPRGVRMGFVGSTGSGKSTLMDLLMGLLSPSEGRILVDGAELSNERIRAWQQTIAHVPQSIFLADTTIAENIAFGVRRKDIDLERVRMAARQAQIAQFIESKTGGYDAAVGERGVQLSGGQRQRIGIARALYKKASVLVLDEATSALDNVTEQFVIDAITGLERDLTILIIAHRLTTVQHCDSIVELERGQVVTQGRYDELIRTSDSFRNAAFVKTAS